MSETTTTVDAGVCRFKTVIIADMDEEMNIVFKKIPRDITRL